MKHINQIIFIFSLFFTYLSHAMLPILLPDIHQAARDGNLERVRDLLNAGADVNSVEGGGSTPLHWAAVEGYETVVKFLIDRGADVNATDKYGNTPLNWAAITCNESVINLLLNAGANANIAAHDGSTPLHLAASKGHIAIVKLLLKRGADVNATTTDGDLFAPGLTPLHLAEQNNRTEVAILLRCWPRYYQKLLNKRRKQMIAFLMAAHPRIGAKSSARILSKELFQHIWEFVKPTIEEIDHFRGNNEVQSNRTWLNNAWRGGAVTTAIAGLSIFAYQLLKRR